MGHVSFVICHFASVSALLLVSCDISFFDLDNSLLHTVNHRAVVCADNDRRAAVSVDLKKHGHDGF